MTWKEHLRKGSLALAGEDYPFAQAELSLALKEAKSSFDDQNRLGVIYGLLAQSFFKQANFEQAEPLLKQAIALENNDPTKTQAKTRDLICLSEILRNRGCTSEAQACLDDAVASLNEPHVSDEISGSEEFAALKNLFASAQAHTSKEHAAANPRAYNAIARTTQNDCQAADQSTEVVEQEYCQLVALVNKLSSTASRNHAKLMSALLNLVKLSSKLGLTEQAEQFLMQAFSLAFGKNHGKHLSIPTGSSVVVPALVTSLMVGKADFYSHIYDFASAAKCFAELMTWMEKHHQNFGSVTDLDSSNLITSFIALTQKADLYASARMLIKQAIELEEYGEYDKAVSVYDKALAIFAQLFPHSHLEVAQLMQFKASALSSAGKIEEAEELECLAGSIEDEVTARSSKAEAISERLPELVL